MTNMDKGILNSEGESDDASVYTEEDVYPENIVALDCEMVGVGQLKKDALARCSIVDYYGNVLYDRFIKPKEPITDYRTKWSGILPHHMKQGIPFKVVRKQVLDIIKDKIIVGKVLKLRKPSNQVRDTSKCMLLRKLANFPNQETPSLKRLSLAVLGRDIQYGTHCSVEDSVAAMDLYRAVEDEWERGKRTKSSKYLGDMFWPKWLEACA